MVREGEAHLTNEEAWTGREGQAVQAVRDGPKCTCAKGSRARETQGCATRKGRDPKGRNLLPRNGSDK